MKQPVFVRRVDRSVIPGGDARWFVFVRDQLVVVESAATVHLPDTATLTALGVQPDAVDLLGDLDQMPCFVGDVSVSEVPLPLQLIDLRRAYNVLPEHDYGLAGLAAQIAHWNRTSRFCPMCATPTERVPTERAKRCPACGLVQYPQVTPAVIVLVYRPGQVLLTRKPEWPPNRYSVIAGFVEPGESLEACLRREVAEEVGVTVDQIRYLGSQPWPFPHQLMVGFSARYQAGDVVIDATELEHAAWFDLDALPTLPPQQSIARRMLDWHLAAFPADPFSV
jgi:NAD+ diphosphatase